MKAFRRSPAARAIAWLVTLTLTAPLLAIGRGPASAQPQQVLRVIMADLVNKKTGTVDALANTATAAVYNELVNAGGARFNVFQPSEVLAEARTLGIRVPSVPGQPANFTLTDLLRIARNLGADAIVQGEVSSGPLVAGKPVSVGISITFLDVASQEPINGGIAYAEAKARPGESPDPEELQTRAIEEVATKVVQQAVQRQLVGATVLNIVSEVVVLNRGLRDGLKVGDELVVSRDLPNGGRSRQGRIRIVRAYATDSEAEIMDVGAGIRPEDTARVVYRAPAVLTLPGRTAPTTQTRSFNFSAVGRTLGVIGLGVLLAVAGRGGQTSVTNVTAEPAAEGDVPVVRITWGDNIFGQANVLQYKIYRNPDFPYSPTLGTGQGVGGGAGGGAGGGGGGVAGAPIGTSPGNIRQFVDRPSPFFPYLNGATVLTGQVGSGSNLGGGVGGGAGGGIGGGAGGGQGGVANSNCGTLDPDDALDTGFTPGRTYQYLVTAIVLRQVVQSTTGGVGGGLGGGFGGIGGGLGGGLGGGFGGIGGGGFGGIGGGGIGGGGFAGGGVGAGGSAVQCIETDPVPSGEATPITPVLLSTPTDNQTINITQFNPTWISRAGADLFQLEISTDRTFTNPNLIFRRQVLSTSPNGEAPQNLDAPIDLSQVPELLNDPAFASYIFSGTPSPPIYWRIGARRDADQPGPLNWLTRNAGDGNRAFRFVYSRVFRFVGTERPPQNPGAGRGRSAALLNRERTRLRSRNAPLPVPGQTASGMATPRDRVPSIQDILTGRGRNRQ